MMGDPRGTADYRRKRQRFLAGAEPVCHWCGARVSDRLPPGHPRKATVDHLAEVDKAPALALNPQLWVVACWTCNSRRGSRYWHDGDGAAIVGVGEPSREW